MKFFVLSILLMTVMVMEMDAKYSDSGEDDCICTLQYAPVCSTNGNTYGNKCQLKCAGEKFDYKGVCK